MNILSWLMGLFALRTLNSSPVAPTPQPRRDPPRLNINPVAPTPQPRQDPPRLNINPEAIAAANKQGTTVPLQLYTTHYGVDRKVFQPAKPLPGIVPKGIKPMAMDEAFGDNYGGIIDSQFGEGMHWLGFPYLAELTQRAEYRRIVETLARDMTRKWLRIEAKGGEDKSEKIKVIENELKNHKVQEKFRRLAELDGFFGRAHLYLDLGLPANDHDAAKVPLIMDSRTFEMGSLKYLQVVEPTWTYPGMYNSINPLARDFYVPTTWYVMGREIHKTRLLTFISRPVPDLLKPAYSFGGLSLSQIAKPYVDNWLRTRQSVSDLVHSFSTPVLATDMSATLNDGATQQMAERAALYNAYRDNRGLLMIDKEREMFSNVQTSLGTLDHLQAQSQEHMASVAAEPLVVLTGITPSGLNASSEGELQVWAQSVHAMQEHLFNDPMTIVIQAIQLSKWGEIDPDISFGWEPLKEESDEEETARRNGDATMHKTYVEIGAVGPDEVRQALADDPDSPYAGLDLSGPPPTPPMPMGPDGPLPGQGGGQGAPGQPGGSLGAGQAGTGATGDGTGATPLDKVAKAIAGLRNKPANDADVASMLDQVAAAIAALHKPTAEDAGPDLVGEVAKAIADIKDT